MSFSMLTPIASPSAVQYLLLRLTYPVTRLRLTYSVTHPHIMYFIRINIPEKSKNRGVFIITVA